MHSTKPDTFATPRLDHLQDDVLLVIIHTLVDCDSLYAACIFSTVCRRLRALAMPILFRRCRFISSLRHFDLDAALRISPYIRKLRVMVDREVSESGADTLLRTLLPRLSCLKTLLVGKWAKGLSFEYVDILFSPPNLEEIVLQHTDWMYPSFDPEITLRVPPLKKYIERRSGMTIHPEKVGSYRVPPTMDPDILPSPCDLLRHVSTTLEVIQLPLHIYHLDILSSLTWAPLRELALYGFYPDTSPPFISVLHAMPNLVSLKILSWSGSLVICPPGLTGIARVPPLQELMIGFISLTDPFFSLLPDSLVSLSIRDAPRHYYTNGRRPDKLVHVDQFKNLFRSRTFPSLRSLEVVFRVTHNDFAAQEAMYQAMIQSCPHISSLEIHCYYLPNRNATLNMTVSALAPLKGLRKLRLNLDLPGLLEFRWLPMMIDYDDYQKDVEGNLEEAAKALPWLDTIGFMCHAKYSSWYELELHKMDDGSLELRNPSFPDDLHRDGIIGPWAGSC
ncbi:hypothetical protein K474DRAFT_1699644 [Panus rudis PR-1116 ss-1]|nr:hypothetical protein K474DRAFT_1699644 [Panus rudis PR-1116 ss-1]